MLPHTHATHADHGGPRASDLPIARLRRNPLHHRSTQLHYANKIMPRNSVYNSGANSGAVYNSGAFLYCRNLFDIHFLHLGSANKNPGNLFDIQFLHLGSANKNPKLFVSLQKIATFARQIGNFNVFVPIALIKID